MTATSAIVSYVVFAVAAVAVLAIWLGLMAIVDRAHRIVADRHWGERGGIFVDILIALGAIVLAGVVFGAACTQCVSSAGAQPLTNNKVIHPAGYHDGCDQEEGDCDGGRYGEGGDYSGHDRNRNRRRNRGAFSPGPFDRSPVDAFNGNQICLPGSTCSAPTTSTTMGEDR